jgi:hypothetical protein
MSLTATNTVSAEKKIDTKKRRIPAARQAFPKGLLLLAGTT